jgi:lipoate-protein ligase A
MELKVIDTGFNTGEYNMEYDLQLVENVKESEFILRFYRWRPYCLSLGANQKEEEINKEKLYADGLTMVRRPTGGRAVLHAEELTYSFVCYIGKYSPMSLYAKINNALLKGLTFYDERCSGLELERVQPDLNQHYKTPEGVACFSTPAKSEVKFGGKKVIGSAQKKIGDKILQHGSILVGSFHKKIVDYLIMNDELKKRVSQTIENQTLTLEDITGTEIDYERLKASIVEGFKQEFNV